MTIELDDDLDALEHRLRAACRAVVPHLLDVSLVESSDERFVGAPDAEVVDHDADSQRRRLLPAAAAVLVLVGVAAVWSTRDQPTRDTDRTDAPAAATTIATVATSSADVQITTSTLPDPPNAGPCTESGCAGFDPLPVTPGATDFYTGPVELGDVEPVPGLFEQLTRCAELSPDFATCQRVEGLAGVELVHYADGTKIGTTFTDLSPAGYATVWGPTQAEGPQTPTDVRGHDAILYLNEADPAVVWQERPGVLVWVSITNDDTDRLMSIAQNVRPVAGPPVIPNRVVVTPLARPWDAGSNDGDGVIAATYIGVECVGLDHVDTCGTDPASRTIVRGSFTPNDPAIRIAGSTPPGVAAVRVEADGVEPLTVETITFAGYTSRFYSTGLPSGSVVSITWLDASGADVLTQHVEVARVDTSPDDTAVVSTVACRLGTYHVAEGDYPALVAQKFDVTVDELTTANTDTPGFDSWAPGLVIEIPCG